jgi:serine/threonine-protein kinase HipA
MRSSQLQVCLKAAAKFQLKETQAAEIMAHQVAVIKDKWASLCDIAGLGEVDRNALWQRQFLNPFAFEGLPEKLAKLAEES